MPKQRQTPSPPASHRPAKRARARKSPPSGLVSVSAIVCENVLQEVDGVHSPIRIVDVFFIQPIRTLPLEKQIFQIRALVISKFKPGDTSEHLLELQLIRPDGSVVPAGEPLKVSALSLEYPTAPGGFNVMAN